MKEHIFGTPDFGFFFTSLGAVLAIYGVYLAYRHKQRKDFALLWHDNYKLFSRDSLEVENIKIISNEIEINQINLQRIYFRNDGNTVLKAEDFFNRFKIEFDTPI